MLEIFGSDFLSVYFYHPLSLSMIWFLLVLSQCRKSVDGLHWLGRCKVDTLTKSTKGGREVHKPALIQQLWKMRKDLLDLWRKKNDSYKHEILFTKIRSDPDQNQKQEKSGVVEFYCDVITYHIWQSRINVINERLLEMRKNGPIHFQLTLHVFLGLTCQSEREKIFLNALHFL